MAWGGVVWGWRGGGGLGVVLGEKFWNVLLVRGLSIMCASSLVVVFFLLIVGFIASLLLLGHVTLILALQAMAMAKH